jgi:RHS repeat-associated protein
MIDVADNNKAYYYHFDGLGSVVALSNSNGDSCQSYQYSVYGQVAASDPNHPNPYMFTGRRFDMETGLYYYRARYYNPHIGRFMQTDPVGYSAGMNLYPYCGNNPIGRVDPSGLIAISFYDPDYGREPFQKDWFKQYADDFREYAFEMNNMGDVINALQKLHKEGVEVTDVYFFDHCMNWEDYPNNPENRKRVYGLQFGDDRLRFDDGSLEKYMKLIGSMRGDNGALTEDATIHFRHCYLGDSEKNADRLESLVDWTGGDVTAVYNTIIPWELTPDLQVKEMVWPHPRGGEVDRPDYRPTLFGFTRAFRDSSGQFLMGPYVRPVVIWPNTPRWTY